MNRRKMERLPEHDFHTLLDFLQEIYALRDIEAFAPHLIRTLPRLVPSEITGYNEVSPKQQRIASLIEPAGVISSNDLLALEKYMHQHPLIMYYSRSGDGQAVKMSDFLTRSHFHRLGLYHEFFQKFQVEDQMAFVMPAPPPLVIGIALNRSQRNFTERERMLLNYLRPHLIQAYRNSEVFTRLKETLDAERGSIVLAKSGRVKEITNKARQWLTEYYGYALQPNERLPETLHRWVKEQENLRGRTDRILSPYQTLVVERKDRELVMRLISGVSSSLLILEEKWMRVPPPSLNELGLSRKETEVLALVALGKTNKEIGGILGLSPRTAQKHLEHIFVKLGVETRTAAASIVTKSLQHS